MGELVLEAGELVIGGQCRVRLRGALGLHDLDGGRIARTEIRPAIVDRIAFRGVQRKHRAVRDIRVVRDREILVSNGALILLVDPEVLAMDGIESREDPLRSGVITEEHVVMQVLGVGLR